MVLIYDPTKIFVCSTKLFSVPEFFRLAMAEMSGRSAILDGALCGCGFGWSYGLEPYYGTNLGIMAKHHFMDGVVNVAAVATFCVLDIANVALSNWPHIQI